MESVKTVKYQNKKFEITNKTQLNLLKEIKESIKEVKLDSDDAVTIMEQQEDCLANLWWFFRSHKKTIYAITSNDYLRNIYEIVFDWHEKGNFDSDKYFDKILNFLLEKE